MDDKDVNHFYELLLNGISKLVPRKFFDSNITYIEREIKPPRNYPKEIWEREIKKFNKRMKKAGYGEVIHPTND